MQDRAVVLDLERCVLGEHRGIDHSLLGQVFVGVLDLGGRRLSDRVAERNRDNLARRLPDFIFGLRTPALSVSGGAGSGLMSGFAMILARSSALRGRGSR